MQWVRVWLVSVCTMCAFGAQAKLNVFTCEPEWAALATEIGGDRVKVYSATTARQDAHRVQAKPSLIAKMRQADLVVCTGAELEVGWLPLLLQKGGNRNVFPGNPGHLEMADEIELIGKKDHVDRSMGDVHAEGNPHLQLDPDRMAQAASVLHQRLVRLAPEHQAQFNAAHDDFSARWSAATARWKAQRDSMEPLKLVVYHANWDYLAEWWGWSIVGSLEPKPGIPPSTAHLKALLGDVKTHGPDAVVYSAYQSDKPARWLGGQLDVPVFKLLSTVDDWDQPNALIRWYDTVIEPFAQLGAGAN